MPTKEEVQAQALSKALGYQSTMNYPAIFTEFAAKGIPVDDIKPRENIFTFNAWKALGRSVKKGEHGVKVVTFVACAGKADNEEPDKPRGSYRRPWTTTVFHVSQTEKTAERRIQ